MAEKGTVDRPDLEEFLSALSGFVDKKSASSPDASYLKFLDIFCRSVGSSEGHLLRPSPSGLESVACFGVDPDFQNDFNRSRTREASPLDDAFTGQKVVAIVEIKKPDVPAWFFSLMERTGYRSLVAVPIIGDGGPTGLLCAYYRDVCLFDQGTLDRLLSVGRMLGGAERSSEKDEATIRKKKGAEPPTGASTRQEAAQDAAAVDGVPAVGDPQADAFAHALTEKPFTKIQVFERLVATASEAFDGAAVICGPVRMVAGEMVITVADGSNVPSATVSHRYTIPPPLRQKLVTDAGPDAFAAAALGEFRSMVKAPPVALLCRPLMWQGKMQAAVFVWRAAAARFTAEDGRRLSRLAAIAALALNAA